VFFGVSRYIALFLLWFVSEIRESGGNLSICEYCETSFVLVLNWNRHFSLKRSPRMRLLIEKNCESIFVLEKFIEETLIIILFASKITFCKLSLCNIESVGKLALKQIEMQETYP